MKWLVDFVLQENEENDLITGLAECVIVPGVH